MPDPTPKPWYIALLDWMEQFLRDNWSGLAVWLYGYEEGKVAAEKQRGKTAALMEAETRNENDVLKDHAGESDDDVIRRAGEGPKPK